MTKTSVLYDGDMGGDDLWAIAMLLAHRDRFDIIGISAVFGNVSQPQAAKNVSNFLHWLGINDIPVAEGANIPCDGMRPFGDDAYGDHGIGGYILPESPLPIQKSDIADWLNTQLHAQTSKITVFATGPATNLALLVTKYPHSIDKIQEIIFMGGALDPIGKDFQPVLMENGLKRVGNITPYAEFNAYQDPAALNILLKSGVSMVFMAADATQYMVLTPDRQDKVKTMHETYGPAFHRMLMAVEALDRTKFGVNGPFIHDPNVVTYALQRDLYEGYVVEGLKFEEIDPNAPNGDHRGEAKPGISTNNALWLAKTEDPDKVWTMMEDSLRRTIENAACNPAHPEE